jgi:hypothetical protein
MTSELMPIPRRPSITRLIFLCLVAAGTLALSSCKGLLLDERFHDKHLGNWTVVDDPEAVEGPSEWRVEEDGWLHQRSNIWGRRGDFINRWYGSCLVAGDEGWRDYRLSVKAKPGDDDGFGVVVRYKDPEHFYRLIFLQDGMSGGPVTRLDKRDGADYTELWSVEKGYRTGTEMMIVVEVKGDRIRAELDGKQLFEVKDGSYDRGKPGLFCYAQSNQAFDDFTVSSR